MGVDVIQVFGVDVFCYFVGGEVVDEGVEIWFVENMREVKVGVDIQGEGCSDKSDVEGGIFFDGEGWGEVDGVVVEFDDVFLVGCFVEVVVVGGDDEDVIFFLKVGGGGRGGLDYCVGEFVVGDVGEGGDSEVEVIDLVLVRFLDQVDRMR